MYIAKLMPKQEKIWEKQNYEKHFHAVSMVFCLEIVTYFVITCDARDDGTIMKTWWYDGEKVISSYRHVIIMLSSALQKLLSIFVIKMYIK